MRRTLSLLSALALLAVTAAGCSSGGSASPGPASSSVPVPGQGAAQLPPDVKQLGDAMAALAPQIPHPVFYPKLIPGGFQAGTPSWDASRSSLEVSFAGPDGNADLTLIQRMPTPTLLESLKEKGEDVAVGDLKARVNRQQQGAAWKTANSIAFLRDGTWVHVDSFRLSVEELVNIAASLQPVAGSHAPIPVAGADDLTDIRKKAEFTVFMPMRLPQGVSGTLLPEMDGAGRVARVGLSLRTEHGDRALYFTQSAADGPTPSWLPKPMKEFPVVNLPSGLPGHVACQPDEHCTMLWWVQDGTYLAVELGAGYSLPKTDLLTLAGSVSGKAALNEARYDLPPAPLSKQ